MIEKFAGYGFNKSHSTAYGAIAYQTAYLKANFPAEFMASLLSCGMESSDRIAEHVDDARRMGIKVLPPDVNRSDVEFSVVGDDLTFGLGAIKGLGQAAVGAIVEERQTNGPYASIFDLAERVDSKLLGKGALELLIKAGALDSLKATRPQHLLLAERAVQAASAIHRDRQMGQKSLFGGGDEPTAKASRERLPAGRSGLVALPKAGVRERGLRLLSHVASPGGERRADPALCDAFGQGARRRR